MRKLTATAGSAAFLVIAPGTVAGLVPWWLTGWQPGITWPASVRITGAVLTGAGAAALLAAFAQFALQGWGTPAPPAPTEQLVVRGLYRYVRNPMYLAVLAAITGQALLLGRPVLLGYAAAVAAAVIAFVHGYEQPTLAQRYGAQYQAYRQAVPGWWPRLPPARKHPPANTRPQTPALTWHPASKATPCQGQARSPGTELWIPPEATMPTIDLPIGPLDYRDIGPRAAGTPAAVFVHGFLVNATLWDRVAGQLAAGGVRCILPDWPLGAHRRPVNPDAGLSPITVADAITGLLDALDLHDVVLVGSDTGGSLCQLALRGDTHRISGLVLTNCDAFEQFPPRFFVPLFTLARSRLAVWTIAQQTRLRAVRHSPLGFGPLLNRPRPASLTRGWIQPLLDSPAIRRDVTRFARGMQRTELAGAATWLGKFEGTVRLVWGTRDKHFTIGLGRRLAAAFPRAQLDEVANATTFVSIDRPGTVVSAVRDVLARSHT